MPGPMFLPTGAMKTQFDEWTRPRGQDEGLMSYAVRKALNDPNLDVMGLATPLQVGDDALRALKALGMTVADNVPTGRRAGTLGSVVGKTVNNASLEAGRGGASAEALGRAAAERAAGKQAFMRGPGGVMRPYVGDAADAVVNPGWEVGYRLPTGGWEKIR